MINVGKQTVIQETAEVIHQWLLDDKAILIDIRETMEYEEEYIPGSLLAPLSCLKPELFPRFKYKKLVLHCAFGRRSFTAAEALFLSGYPTEIINMEGGIYAWKNADLPTLGTEVETAIADEALYKAKENGRNQIVISRLSSS